MLVRSHLRIDLTHVTFIPEFASKVSMEGSQEKRSATEITSLEDFEPTQIAHETPSRPRAGELCPVCQRERLDYDGLLNLSCPNCGVAVGGCFT